MRAYQDDLQFREASIKLSSVATDILGVSGRAMIEARIADMPAAQAPPAAANPDDAGEPAYLAAVDRLDEITGVGRHAAQVIIAEVGLSMAIFPTAGHLVSWAKLSPRANQSGAKTRSGKTGKGNPYLKSVLGEVAASAGRTNTFLGARYRRLARRIGKLSALVAVARSILVIVWHLLADPTRRYRDLGPEFFDNRIRPERRKINHVRQLEALGYTVTLTPQPDYQPRRQFIFRSGNRELRCV